MVNLSKAQTLEELAQAGKNWMARLRKLQQCRALFPAGHPKEEQLTRLIENLAAKVLHLARVYYEAARPRLQSNSHQIKKPLTRL